MVALNNARVEALDTKRLADLNQVAKAIELYQLDNGHYPDSVGQYTCFDCTWSQYVTQPIVNPNDLTIADALEDYVHHVHDPKRIISNAFRGYLYISTPGGTAYKLIAYYTPEDMRNFNTQVWDPARCTTINAAGQCTAPTNRNTIGFWTPGAVNY